MNISRSLCFAYIVSHLCLMSAHAHTNSDDNLGYTENRSEMPSATLEPIVINARGIKESPIETPFVVKTIYSHTLDEQNINTASEVLRSEPSIDIHNGGHVEYSSLWMRGTGSLSITSLDDNSVDIRVDGISNGKSGLGRNLIDVDQVEIAKGPQGTLQGSSAEAGSISIKTTDPKDWFGGHVGVGIGNKNHKSVEAVINVPLSDNVAMRLAGVTSKTDNYLNQRENGDPLNIKDKEGIQGKLRWHNDNNDVVIGGYHDTQTNDVPLLQLDFDSNEVATFGLDHNSKSVSQGVTVATKHNVGFAQLETNGGYHAYKGDISRPSLPPEMLPLYYAALGLPAAIQPQLNPIFAQTENNRQFVEENVKQLSQEVRLVSQPDSHIKWVAGAYIEDRKRDWHNDGKIALNALPANNPIKVYLTTTADNGDTYKSYDKETQAIFGEITYPVTDALNLVAGARYTHEKINHNVTWTGNANNALAAAGTKSDSITLDDDAVTGRLGLNYAINPNWHVYGIYSRGNKFGNFADYETSVAYGSGITYLKPTTINAAEIGTKLYTKDNRLILGVALYQNRMQDDHAVKLGVQPTYKSIVANIDTQSTGAEVSIDWEMTDHLKLKTDLAYTDTEVTSNDNAQNSTLTKKGNQLPQVPEFSGSIALRYSDELTSLPLLNNAQWYMSTNYRYVGKRFAEANNILEFDAYGLLGVNMGITTENHELSIWGNNLTNEKYLYLGINQGPFNVGTVGPDRSYGVKYSYYF